MRYSKGNILSRTLSDLLPAPLCSTFSNPLSYSSIEHINEHLQGMWTVEALDRCANSHTACLLWPPTILFSDIFIKVLVTTTTNYIFPLQLGDTLCTHVDAWCLENTERMTSMHSCTNYRPFHKPHTFGHRSKFRLRLWTESRPGFLGFFELFTSVIVVPCSIFYSHTCIATALTNISTRVSPHMWPHLITNVTSHVQTRTRGLMFSTHVCQCHVSNEIHLSPSSTSTRASA